MLLQQFACETRPLKLRLYFRNIAGYVKGYKHKRMEKKDPTKPLPEDEDFDPDDYIRTAVTYGRLDLVKDWLPHHHGDPHRVSELVLFPAAMFGQLELLSCGLDYGELPLTADQFIPTGYKVLHH